MGSNASKNLNDPLASQELDLIKRTWDSITNKEDFGKKFFLILLASFISSKKKRSESLINVIKRFFLVLFLCLNLCKLLLTNKIINFFDQIN